LKAEWDCQSGTCVQTVVSIDRLLHQAVTFGGAMYNTLVVNLFAGPGAGKTTSAFELTALLMKQGIITEYVGEYAKELVWQGKLEALDGTLENQRAVFREQDGRVKRLLGKVDVIVTDSPALLSLVYVRSEDHNTLFNEVIQTRAGRRSFNYFVEREIPYVEEGRKHSFSDALGLDLAIRGLLNDLKIEFMSLKGSGIAVEAQRIKQTARNLKYSF
jgi:hypothetical protein